MGEQRFRGCGTGLCSRKLEALVCQVGSVNQLRALKDGG